MHRPLKFYIVFIVLKHIKIQNMNPLYKHFTVCTHVCYIRATHKRTEITSGGLLHGSYQWCRFTKRKRVEIGLTYIYGIGRVSSNRILKEANVNPDTRVRDFD